MPILYRKVTVRLRPETIETLQKFSGDSGFNHTVREVLENACKKFEAAEAALRAEEAVRV